VGREEPFRAELEALLPLPPEEFRRDFPDPHSTREFDGFLAVAQDVRVARESEHLEVVAPGMRESAYAAAASELVACSDVLLAVWDGAPAARVGPRHGRVGPQVREAPRLGANGRSGRCFIRGLAVGGSAESPRSVLRASRRV
jgi:hypothetical protein